MKQLALLVAGMLFGATAFAQGGKPVPVTADNFTRAETDTYFANIVAQAGGTSKFFHRRELEPVDSQIVIRANRDTVYSAAVFDLDAGPVTVTLPDAGKRFRSMIVIDEDQYTPAVVYEAGRYTYTKAQIGTRYLMLALRTLVDPTTVTVSSNVHADQAALASDDDGATTWSTVDPQQRGDQVTVDLGSATRIRSVVLDAGPSSYGFFSDGTASDAAPASYRLEVSRDGRTWTTVRTAHGTGQLTTMTVPHSPLRYVRATLTADAPLPWTIAEVRVYR